MENVHSKNGVQHYETLVTQILAINYLYINCGSFSFQSSSPQIMYTCIMYCISLIYSIWINLTWIPYFDFLTKKHIENWTATNRATPHDRDQNERTVPASTQHRKKLKWQTCVFKDNVKWTQNLNNLDTNRNYITLISQKNIPNNLDASGIAYKFSRPHPNQRTTYIWSPFRLTFKHTHTRKSHGSAGPFEDVNRNQASSTWNLYILYHMVEFFVAMMKQNKWSKNLFFSKNHRNQKCWKTKIEGLEFAGPSWKFQEIARVMSITASIRLVPKNINCKLFKEQKTWTVFQHRWIASAPSVGRWSAVLCLNKMTGWFEVLVPSSFVFKSSK